MILKTCNKCMVEKNILEFYIRKDSKNGYFNKCKACCARYSEENKEKILIKVKKYAENNIEKVKGYKTKYRIKNKEKRNIEERNRKKYDPLYKLKHDIRNLLLSSFKKNKHKKKSKTTDILGCSIEKFKIHIEKQFESWMTWNNHGIYNPSGPKTWQMDHIIPIYLAKTENELVKLNHYSNFRPLESLKNLKKSNKHEI